MALLRYRGAAVQRGGDETVLEALERAGVAPPSSCRAGACQSCLLRARSGTPPAEAQRGVRESLRLRGYFLACSARPDGDLELDDGDEDRQIEAEIAEIGYLSGDVLGVRLLPRRPFDHRAGQYVTVRREGGPSRSYSIASLPEAGAVELHVRVVPGGAMSGWLAHTARVGHTVSLQGPAGDCFYLPDRPTQDLLLAGTGTGAAPLLGILRDALRHGHVGRVVVVHGARTQAGLYLDDVFSSIARAHANVSYHRALLAGEAHEGTSVGSLDAVLAEIVPAPKGWGVVLCGDPAVVHAARRRVFLAGAAMADIRADAFVRTAPTRIDT